MFKKLFGSKKTNWKESRAHLMFLSKFKGATDPENICKQPYWFDILPETPQKLITRFKKERVLEDKTFSVEEAFSHFFSAKDLKNVLREHGLKVSGTKYVMIERIMQLDKAKVESLLPKIMGKYLTLSEDGEQIVKAFEEKESSEFSNLLTSLVAAIKKKNTRETYLIKKEFSEKRELKEYNQTRNKIEAINSPEIWLKTLHIILNCEKISILKSISDNDFERFRIAAALSFIIGKQDLEKYEVEDIETDLGFNNATASRMIIFYGRSQYHILKAKENGIKRVIFHTVGGCPVCKDLDNKTFNIDDAPIIPHENCTNNKGCRCYYENIWEDLL
jgi:hypothetical protein